MHSIRLWTWLSVFLGGLVSFTAPTMGQSAEFPAIENLKRGHFEHAVINRDETRLLTATANLVQLWDQASGELLQKFEGHEAPIHSICFSPDERQILTGGGKTTEHGREDPTVRLWDVSTGNSVAVLTPVGKKSVSPWMCIRSARYSPNGQQVLAACSIDAAVLWNLESENIDLVVRGISTDFGTGDIRRVILEPVQFSPDGNWLSGLTNDASQAVVWNASTGDVRWKFNAADPSIPDEEHHYFCQSGQWSPSGKYLLAASDDRKVRVWDVSTGKEIQRFQGHTDRIGVALFCSNESQVLTASDDRTVRFWDLQSGEQLQRWDYPGPVQQLSVSPDGKRVLTRTIQLNPKMSNNRWFGELRDSNSGESIRKWELPPMWIAENQPLMAYRSSVMSPSGRLVLTTVWTEGEVKVTLIDAKTGIARKAY